MSTAPIAKIPMPLQSEEIKNGIVADIREAGAPPEVCEVIRRGLNNTCSLNRQCYSKFVVKWFIKEGAWAVDYVLDDFGRETRGVIGGTIEDHKLTLEGEINPMPPDTFRRKTEQPVPKPQVVKPSKEDGVGMTVAHKGGGKKKMV